MTSRAQGDGPEVAYFRDLERAFVLRRGDPLFISNADWVLLARLRKKHVPMRVVLRGIADAFDAHAHSFSRKEKIRSLKFCETEINSAVERYRRALQAEGPSGRGLGGAIEKLEERVAALPVPAEIAAAVAEARRQLVEIARSVTADKTFDTDKALARAEARLVDAASSALGADELAGFERASREVTAAYKSRMPAKVYETLMGESVRRKVLQRFGLPRFLLAEIE